MVFRCHGYTSSSPAMGGIPPTACNAIRGPADFDCACSEPPRLRWSVITASRVMSGFVEANLREFMILIPFGLLSRLDGSI